MILVIFYISCYSINELKEALSTEISSSLREDYVVEIEVLTFDILSTNSLN